MSQTVPPDGRRFHNQRKRRLFLYYLPAAERAKAWYFHPVKCSALDGTGRQIRSQRREAGQIALEVIVRHLDLASMCVRTPTPASGFVDIDMKIIVCNSGIGQRRLKKQFLCM
ncbi:MAG: hypothetical protein LBT47_08295 [Deltaproteobacteria bacterium]|jgi:hypothetical protein|nr:hypothetical protein [Deltaproteobacteria bacterium]